FDGSYRVKRVCKENSIVEYFESEAAGHAAIKVNSEFVSSSPGGAPNEVEELESYEALRFAEEVLVTPQIELIDHTIVDYSSVVNVDDDTDNDVHVGMSASKRKWTSKNYRKYLMCNTDDDFDEEIPHEIDGYSSVVKVKKE
ncbi:hypothetical protein A2U01_0040284, partial [Trifolium medium]|nr:hypothetical protein [Trifolium medium]